MVYILENDNNSTFKIFFIKSDFLYGPAVDTSIQDTYIKSVGTQWWRVLVCEKVTLILGN